MLTLGLWGFCGTFFRFRFEDAYKLEIEGRAVFQGEIDWRIQTFDVCRLAFELVLDGRNLDFDLVIELAMLSTSYTGGLQIGTFGTFNMAAISLFLHRLSHFFFNSFEISWSRWLLTRKYRKKIIVQTKWEVRCDIMKYHNFLAAVSISQWGILYKPAAGNVKNYLIIKNIRKMGLLIGERLSYEPSETILELHVRDEFI